MKLKQFGEHKKEDLRAVRVILDDGFYVRDYAGKITGYYEEGRNIEFKYKKSTHQLRVPHDYNARLNSDGVPVVGACIDSEIAVPIFGDHLPTDRTLGDTIREKEIATESLKATEVKKLDYTKLFIIAGVVILIVAGIYFYQDYQKSKLPPTESEGATWQPMT